MRYIHRNQRDTRSIDLVGEHRSDMLIDLEFDHQIDPVAHELIRVAQSSGTVIAIVEHDQVDAGGRRCSLQTVGDGFGKWHIRRLTAKSESRLLGSRHQAVQPILRLRQVAAVHKGFQNAINGRLGNAGALVDGFERQRTLFVLQKLEYVERFREYRNEVQPLGS